MRVFISLAASLLLILPAIAVGEELKLQIPELQYFDKQDPQYAYDLRSMNKESAQKIAGYFYKKYGNDEFPIIYRLPGIDDHYLASIYGKSTKSDFGRRFVLIREDSGSYQELFHGKGAGDSYMLRPYFFVSKGHILIIAEQGAEYTWGHSVYLFEKSTNTMRTVGYLNVAKPPTGFADTTTPVPDAKVFLEPNRVEIRFYTDLIYDPGGMKDKLIKRKGEYISFVLDNNKFVMQKDTYLPPKVPLNQNTR